MATLITRILSFLPRRYGTRIASLGFKFRFFPFYGTGLWMVNRYYSLISSASKIVVALLHSLSGCHSHQCDIVGDISEYNFFKQWYCIFSGCGLSYRKQLNPSRAVVFNNDRTNRRKVFSKVRPVFGLLVWIKLLALVFS